MKTWQLPNNVEYNATELSKIIKVRAWSVASAYSI